MTQTASEILAIKAAVRARDSFCCTECGMTTEEHQARYNGRILQVHRLKPGSLYTVEGCVTLCHPCHGPQPKRKPGEPDLAIPTYGKKALNVWIDPVIRDGVDTAVERSRPRSSLKYIVEVALEEWLRSQGILPPRPDA